MLFLTVGYQMSFDRLTTAVDNWASEHSGIDIFAQVGPSEFKPSHIEWTQFLEPPEFSHKLQTCSGIIAHAGMGSILTALQYGKPIVIMPRKGSLRETRNDHQIATARRFESYEQILVAMTEEELPEKLNQLQGMDAGVCSEPVASVQLIDALKAFIHA